MFINDTSAWRKATDYFMQKSKDVFKDVSKSSSYWGSEKDH